jgi:hypothetical protein
MSFMVGLQTYLERTELHKNGRLFVFLSTADQHSQEQDKHQDAEQDFEWLPDVCPRR